jgi:hypothetical protein
LAKKIFIFNRDILYGKFFKKMAAPRNEAEQSALEKVSL